MSIIGIFRFINEFKIYSNLELIKNKNPFCKRKSGNMRMKKMDIFHDL